MEISIGKYLEYLRMSCGYSLRDAAKKTNLSHGYIRDVELGDNRSAGSQIIPMPQTLKKFADAYTASFDELMRIAGHIHSDPQLEFEFIELDFSTILYVEVDYNNNIIYHGDSCRYIERKSLHDFIIFEEQLENNRFLKVQGGLYANLIKIKAYDSKSGRLYFKENMEGHYLELSWIRASKIRKIISNAISKNTEKNLEPSLNSNSFTKIIRNIVSN